MRLHRGMAVGVGVVLAVWVLAPHVETQPSTLHVLNYGLNPSAAARQMSVTATGGAWIGGEAVDGAALAGNPIRQGVSDGTGIQTWKGPSLANYPTSQTATARAIVGGGIVEKSGHWGNFSQPAVSLQASIAWAAEAATRHVADCVSFSGGSTTAPVLTQLTVNLRDGATGAGTVLQTWIVIIPAATGQNVVPFSVCGLNLVGTTNTAMTLEFSALLTNLFEAVSLTGYNVQ